jgi:hypothetical protein
MTAAERAIELAALAICAAVARPDDDDVRRELREAVLDAYRAAGAIVTRTQVDRQLARDVNQKIVERAATHMESVLVELDTPPDVVALIRGCARAHVACLA